MSTAHASYEPIPQHESTSSSQQQQQPGGWNSSNSSQEGGTNMEAEVVQTEMETGNAEGVILVLPGVSHACSRHPPAQESLTHYTYTHDTHTPPDLVQANHMVSVGHQPSHVSYSSCISHTEKMQCFPFDGNKGNPHDHVV